MPTQREHRCTGAVVVDEHAVGVARRQARCLREEVQLAATVLRTNRHADCAPLIDELQATLQFLQTRSGEACLHLLRDPPSRPWLQELLGVCAKADATQDALRSFKYPAEDDSDTLLGTLGLVLLEILEACNQKVNQICSCCTQGTDLFLNDKQRQLLPGLTQLIPQATAALNAAHDYLHTLPTPWPSDSPHQLLLGIASLLVACLTWGGPPNDPKPFSTLIAALARHHTVDAAIRLLTALQDPTLVATPATPATHPLLHETVHAITFANICATSAHCSWGARLSTATDTTLTPAARRALRTHLLSDHHLLLHLLHTTAACCHAPPNPTAMLDVPPTPDLTPAVREKVTRDLQPHLERARAWLTCEEAAHAPLHSQRCYAASPATVWRGVRQLLEAVSTPQGWQVAGPDVLRLVEALPLSDLAKNQPAWLSCIADHLLHILLNLLQEVQWRRQQLRRRQPRLLEVLTGVNWEARRERALQCLRSAAKCAAMLAVLAQDEYEGAPLHPAVLSMLTCGILVQPPITQHLLQPHVSRQLQPFLGAPEAAAAAASRGHNPRRQHAQDILQRLTASLDILAGARLGMRAPKNALDAWMGYRFAAWNMLLVFLRGVPTCLLALVMRKLDWWTAVCVPDLLVSWWDVQLGASLWGMTLSPGLALLEACPSSPSEVLSRCGKLLRRCRRAAAEGKAADGRPVGGAWVEGRT